MGVTVTIVKEVANDFVTGLAGYRVGVLEEAGNEDNEKDFEDWVRFDQADLAECSGPEEIAFAEYTAPEPAGYAEENEDQIVDW